MDPAQHMGVTHTTTVAQFYISTFFHLQLLVCNQTQKIFYEQFCFFKRSSNVCEIYGQKSIEVNWDINLGVLPPPGPITSPIFQTGDISN